MQAAGPTMSWERMGKQLDPRCFGREWARSWTHNAFGREWARSWTHDAFGRECMSSWTHNAFRRECTSSWTHNALEEKIGEQLDPQCVRGENWRAARPTMPRERMGEQLDPRCLGREWASSWIYDALGENGRAAGPTILSGENGRAAGPTMRQRRMHK